MKIQKIELNKYIEVCKQFSRESADWYDLDNYNFYSCKEDMSDWYESCDCANGGFDVSWAFHKTDEEIEKEAFVNLKNEVDMVNENYEIWGYNTEIIII